MPSFAEIVPFIILLLVLLLLVALTYLIGKVSFKGKRLYQRRKAFGFFQAVVAIFFFWFTYDVFTGGIGETDRHVHRAAFYLRQADRELFRYMDGEEFLLESVSETLRESGRTDGRVYFQESDLPDNLKALLRPDELPYVKKHSFRIISVGSRGKKSVIFVRNEKTRDEDIRSREIEYDLWAKN